jgi:hypothetical protein
MECIVGGWGTWTDAGCNGMERLSGACILFYTVCPVSLDPSIINTLDTIINYQATPLPHKSLNVHQLYVTYNNH